MGRRQGAEVAEWQTSLLGKSGAEACFADPERTARNNFTGVFVKEKGVIRPQFIFFGSGIGVAKKGKAVPYRDLLGTEIEEEGRVRGTSISGMGTTTSRRRRSS